MKLHLRIEKWVMGMQDVDFELTYEPGKDRADPFDFLSRQFLPETGKDIFIYLFLTSCQDTPYQKQERILYFLFIYLFLLNNTLNTYNTIHCSTYYTR